MCQDNQWSNIQDDASKNFPIKTFPQNSDMDSESLAVKDILIQKEKKEAYQKAKKSIIHMELAEKMKGIQISAKND